MTTQKESDSRQAAKPPRKVVPSARSAMNARLSLRREKLLHDTLGALAAWREKNRPQSTHHLAGCLA
jgi:hypothetical protein